MRLLQHRIAGPEPCPYLPGLDSSTETLLMTGVGAADLERLLLRGYRRFGPIYFRPVCAGCQECVSVRVPVATFAPSANLRRVWKRASGLRVQIEAPSVDARRLALYRRWHEGREEERGWKPDRIDPDSYAMQFCFPHAAAREFSYWEGTELVGVGLTDETPSALSAVYCYYDPERTALSIGTFNVLVALDYARAKGLSYVYLGYRVEGCPSLRYKGRFRPQERLVGRPGEREQPHWAPAR